VEIEPQFPTLQPICLWDFYFIQHTATPVFSHLSSSFVGRVARAEEQSSLSVFRVWIFKKTCFQFVGRSGTPDFHQQSCCSKTHLQSIICRKSRISINFIKPLKLIKCQSHLIGHIETRGQSSNRLKCLTPKSLKITITLTEGALLIFL